MHTINYRHLHAFISVAQHASFTKAAEHLHLTQSTLTSTVKQLEQEVGFALLDRTTRSVTLTKAGEPFLDVAIKLVADFDVALGDLKALALQQQGHVSFAASASVITTLLPEVLAEYHQAFPNVSMLVMEEGASAVEGQVLENTVDFGIGSNHSKHPELEYRPLLSDRYGLLVPADSEHCTADCLPWSVWHDSKKVLLTKDNGIRLEVDDFLLRTESDGTDQQRHNKTKHTLIEATTPTSLAALLKAGLGITVMPALAATTEAFVPYHFIPLEKPIMAREMCIITRKQRTLSPTGQELLSRIEQRIRYEPLPAHVRCLL
jgi:DNA-binding transcriptional LysR family regulator